MKVAEAIGWFVITGYISGALGFCDFKVCIGEVGTCQMKQTVRKGLPP